MSSHNANTRDRRRAMALVLSMVALVVTACASSANEAVTTQLVVSAAASLTDAFHQIETMFEDSHPEVDVVLNLAGSSTLRDQILEGAPTDVFASANTENMDRVVEAGAVATDPRVFAVNRLQIAVPGGNPAGVKSLTDFGRDELLIGLCAEQVPCGQFAREALEKAGVTPSIDTNEQDVRALLTRIEAGELDAGITYVTDVIAADGAVDGVDIPEEQNVIADYPIAVMSASAHESEAAEFVEFVLSDQGKSVLREYGFGTP